MSAPASTDRLAALLRAQLDREERLLLRRKRAIGQELAEIEQQLAEIAAEKRQDSAPKIVAFRAETR